MKFIRLFFIFILPVFWIETTIAEQPTDYDMDDLLMFDLEQLRAIHVVTASKHSQPLGEAPAVVSVLTRKEIDLLNFDSLEEVMEYVVGISSVNGEGNVFTTTTIRGNTLVNYQTNTLLLFDGYPIFSPYHGSFDFANIPVSSIGRIEVVKGSNSVLYGTNAVNAVINIIPLEVSEKQKISGKIRYGSNETIHKAISYQNKTGHLKMSAFAEATDSDGETFRIRDEKGNAVNYQKEKRTRHLIAKLEYNNFSLNLMHMERKLPNFKTRGFETVNGSFMPEKNVEKADQIGLHYTHHVNDSITVSFRSAYYDWQL